VLAKLVELEHLAGERLGMGCLQKGHWSQFYLQKRIFRTLFVSRVLSLKVMVRPGNTILVLNIFFCLLACISLFVFLLTVLSICRTIYELTQPFILCLLPPGEFSLDIC